MNNFARNTVYLLATVLFTLAIPLFATQSTAATLTIVYSGPLRGELEPCGCTIDTDLGGIRRLATAIDALRSKDPALVLISTGGLLATTQPAHEVTNRFILKGLAALDYDAIGLRWADLIYGTGPLSADGLPWVASNWQAAQPDFSVEPNRLIERDGQRIAFLQWLTSDESPHQGQPLAQQPVHRDISRLEYRLRELKSQSVLTILGVTGDVRAIQHLTPGLVDILLLGSPDEQVANPEHHDNTITLKAGTRGQRLGLLKLVSDLANTWSVQSHKVITLDESVTDARRLDSWYAQYERELVKDYRERARRAKENRAEGGYAGDAVCEVCHAKQKARWLQTDHGHAFQSLTKVSKQFDANCIGCHVVGFGKPGGFYSAQAKPDLRNVGCEACHGPAKDHQRHGGTKPLEPVTNAVCRKCHNAEHSPTFDPDAYRARIIHWPPPESPQQ